MNGTRSARDSRSAPSICLSTARLIGCSGDTRSAGPISTRSRYVRAMTMNGRWNRSVTKKGDRVGDRLVKAITPRAADKLYDKFIECEGGERLRTGEKLVVLCRKAWRVVRRLFPD